MPHTDASRLTSSSDQLTKTIEYLPSDHIRSSHVMQSSTYLRNSAAGDLRHLTSSKTHHRNLQNLTNSKTHCSSVHYSKPTCQEAHPSFRLFQDQDLVS
ncbi:hypothetical protein O181_028001 [Austropuccinia psidii MF-1]|uniref:Uncharacterized protein n=1 Tax=Austropuccinia psidii MF-1 TaxID=1389203 RepID=A0A9Q3CTL3_9BASI|nr:hypothetical protein [Austropuccinia psidii MF-1]